MDNKINESVKNQVKEIVLEMILDALENGNARDAIASMRDSIKTGFNEALDASGATDNGFSSWRFQR